MKRNRRIFTQENCQTVNSCTDIDTNLFSYGLNNDYLGLYGYLLSTTLMRSVSAARRSAVAWNSGAVITSFSTEKNQLSFIATAARASCL